MAKQLTAFCSRPIKRLAKLEWPSVFKAQSGAYHIFLIWGIWARGRLKRAWPVPHARCCCRHRFLRSRLRCCRLCARRRGLAPRVGSGGRERLRGFRRLYLFARARRRGPASRFLRVGCEGGEWLHRARPAPHARRRCRHRARRRRRAHRCRLRARRRGLVPRVGCRGRKSGSRVIGPPPPGMPTAAAAIAVSFGGVPAVVAFSPAAAASRPALRSRCRLNQTRPAPHARRCCLRRVLRHRVRRCRLRARRRLAPRVARRDKGRLQRARPAQLTRRYRRRRALRRRVRRFRFRARRLAPCVGRGGGCWGRGRLRCFRRLHFRARCRGPAPHFAGGRFIDQSRLAHRTQGRLEFGDGRTTRHHNSVKS